MSRTRTKSQGKKQAIGIWWKVRDEVVSFPADPGAVQPLDGVKDALLDHIRVWPRVAERFPHLRHVEYDEIPRGRVIQKGDQFVLLIGPAELKDKRLLARIMQAFGLPKGRTQVLVDEHYATGIPGTTHSLLTDEDSDDDKPDDLGEWPALTTGEGEDH